MPLDEHTFRGTKGFKRRGGFITVGESHRNKQGTLVHPHKFVYGGRVSKKTARKNAQAQNAAIHIRRGF